MALGGPVLGKAVSMLLVCLLVAGALAPPATAQAVGEPPDISVSVERTADDSTTVRYRLVFDDPRQVTSLWLINYSGNVVSSEGFVTAEARKGNYALRWDGETESPSVTVTVDVNDGASREFTATDEWLLAPTPRLSVAWKADEGDEWQYRHPLQDDYPDATVEFPDSGVLGSSFTYVGAYEEFTHRADGQRFRMVVADGASPSDSPSQVFESLTTASKRLPGKSPDEVLAFVLPDPSWRGGYASPNYDEIWVHEDARLSDPQNLWIHEYVHTRQSFKLGEKMTWFREASAAYLASDLTMDQGLTSQSAVARTLTVKGSGESVLSNSDTWAGNEVPYYHGAFVLWGLDAKIQKATDGKRSLLDVFDRMNSHDGPVSYADFQTIVADVAGQSMNPWLDQHVTTPTRPELQEIVSGVDGSSGSDSYIGASSSDGGKSSGGSGSGNSGAADAIRSPAMTGDLSSTLVLWGGLGLIGLVFGLMIVQYVSGLVEQVRKK